MDHTHEGWPVPNSEPIPLRDWDDITVTVFDSESFLTVAIGDKFESHMLDYESEDE